MNENELVSVLTKSGQKGLSGAVPQPSGAVAAEWYKKVVLKQAAPEEYMLYTIAELLDIIQRGESVKALG